MKTKFKLAGSSANVVLRDGKIFYDRKYADDYLVCEQAETSNVFSFQEHFLPMIKKTTQSSSFEDGRYHVYFTGTVVWNGGHNSESGIWEGWDKPELDYVHWKKLNDTMKE